MLVDCPHFLILYAITDFNEVDIRNYQPEKVIFTEARGGGPGVVLILGGFVVYTTGRFMF